MESKELGRNGGDEMTARELIEEIQSLIDRGTLSPTAQVTVFYDCHWYSDIEVDKDSRTNSRNTLCIDMFD